MEPSLRVTHVPLVQITLWMITGIISGVLIQTYHPFPLHRVSAVFLISSLLTLIICAVSPRSSHLLRLLFLLSLFLFSIWRGAMPIQEHRESEQWVVTHLTSQQNPLTWYGEVKRSGKTERRRSWIDVKLKRLSFDDSDPSGPIHPLPARVASPSRPEARPA